MIHPPLNLSTTILLQKFIIVLLLSPIVPLFAQGNSLKNIVGGQVNLLNLKGGEYKNGEIVTSEAPDARTQILDLQPYAAWVISNHFLLGFQLGFGKTLNSYSAYSNGGTSMYTRRDYSTALSAGIFSRYYLRPAAKFGLFLEPQLYYSQAKFKNNSSYGSNRSKSQLYTAQVSPGIAYHITEHLGLLLRMGEVGYAVGKNNYGYSQRHDDLFFNFSFTSFAWGVEYRWGGMGEKE